MKKHCRIIGGLAALLAAAIGRIVFQDISIQNIPSSTAITGMILLLVIFVYDSQKKIKLKKLSKIWISVEIIFSTVIILEIILELISNKNASYYEMVKTPFTVLQMVLLCTMIIPIALMLSKKS